MTATTSTVPIPTTRPTTTHLPAILALALGAVIIFVAGLSHSTTMHNAAHDARHAAGFPCH
jgi:cobalt transporter subunit CbtB